MESTICIVELLQDASAELAQFQRAMTSLPQNRPGRETPCRRRLLKDQTCIGGLCSRAKPHECLRTSNSQKKNSQSIQSRT